MARKYLLSHTSPDGTVLQIVRGRLGDLVSYCARRCGIDCDAWRVTENSLVAQGYSGTLALTPVGTRDEARQGDLV